MTTNVTPRSPLFLMTMTCSPLAVPTGGTQAPSQRSPTYFPKRTVKAVLAAGYSLIWLKINHLSLKIALNNSSLSLFKDFRTHVITQKMSTHKLAHEYKLQSEKTNIQAR